MNLKNKNIAIIGLGLMGGAIADGIKKLNPKAIFAFDKNQEVLEEALKKDIISFGTSSEKTLEEVLNQTDLVFICLYPHDTINFFERFMPYFKPGSIVTDIVGIKEAIINKVNPILREDITYIPGHPMAGSEKEGFGEANAAIFDNRNYVLVPLENTNKADFDFFKDLVKALGFSHLTITNAKEHDKKIAFTSELCHVIASALVDSEDDLTITDFEGGSFGDLTRIAMINAPMWTEIFIENKDYLLEEIDAFENSMKKLRAFINDSNKEELINLLHNVREKRVAMEVDRRNKHRGHE